ncbi:MutS-related protein [Amycolatopsis silviterrae]|uniref:DNA mismatch repair proteins mutS family domain-containing protein n=1 Tax=Amycolatopsis silviterrae TaxID=1656914 RepID=A0ABW5HQD4_9PSEU
MKVFLLHPDRDFDAEGALPANEAVLTADLELDVLYDAMAEGDGFRRDVAREVLAAGSADPEVIRYRQHVLADCLRHDRIVRELYDIALEALKAPKKVWFGILLHSSPENILHRSVKILEVLTENLKQLSLLAQEQAGQFRSTGFRRFFAMVSEELDAGYFAVLEEHLQELELPRGVLMSAELGPGNKGVRHALHKPEKLSWWERLTGHDRDSAGFQVPARDEAGARALTDLAGHGVNLAANALAQSADHVLDFFTVLRKELAFYLGCLALRERLERRGLPVCFPEPEPSGQRVLAAKGLYDAGLALSQEQSTVGNDLAADGSALVVVTGANQGGKSTFLRSIGLAQLMMQCGMFVAAEAFRADLRRRVFTHFKREEDATMTTGKLDEELARMSEIADLIEPGDLVLCNESFASTNEREGSEIGRQVLRAFTGNEVKVVFVTHLFDLAHSLYEQEPGAGTFLRAERRPDGSRTFRLSPGEPLPTSYGEDSYRRIFAEAEA